MAIKALLMDFYGTLVHENDGLIRELTRRVCDTSPLVVAPGDVAHYWWETMTSLFHEHSGQGWKSLMELEDEALREVSERFESHIDIRAALDEIAQSWLRPDAFSDTRQFMWRLPLPVCIVANGDSDPIAAAASHAQLEGHAIVTSEDARSYKPDLGIFYQALKVMGVKASEALFVGDSIHYDMHPAQSAGMYTAWINRTGRPLGGRCLPDVTCDNLQQLRGMIK
jgi:2-haloacid dehalogenase/putative hydrolase of the HAD superfamily